MSNSIQNGRELVIVDDDSVLLELVCSIISKCRFSHRAFIDPNEAFDYVKEQVPRVILADYRMPKQNGLALLESLHKSCDMSSTTSFICSSIALPVHIEKRALKIGARCIVKDQLFEKGYIEKLYYDA